MAKKWEDLTQTEKIEDLRRDMLTTMAMVNLWIEHQKRLGEFHHDLMTKHDVTSNRVSEVSEALRILAERVAKLA